jgi:gliding motility-associated lipoprotein GldD
MILLSVSCSSDYSPKPKGYFNIELPEPVYLDYINNNYFQFSVSNQARVEELNNFPAGVKENKGVGLNIVYPRFRAQFYCSYIQVNKSDFPSFMKESQDMVYIREKKAKGVKETEYNNPKQKVYGFVYEIQGDAASPVQFLISDSINSFFRGALFFDTHINRDSIAPVLEYINKDIKIMIESFQWKQ